MLVVGKAYPVIDQRSMTEAVCVAGIDMGSKPRWVRLFPLDFRSLDDLQKFSKYDVIDLRVVKSRRDPRPESVTPDLGSISVVEKIDTDGGSWRRRLSALQPLEAASMCQLQRGLSTGGPTLGFFPVKEVRELVIVEQTSEFKLSQAAIQSQTSLLGGGAADGDRRELEPIPDKFKYRYTCHDSNCHGHEQTIVDWELGALYRKLSWGHSAEEVERQVRSKFFDDLCGSDRQVWFVVGTMLGHPMSFIVLGLVSPKKDLLERSESLF